MGESNNVAYLDLPPSASLLSELVNHRLENGVGPSIMMDLAMVTTLPDLGSKLPGYASQPAKPLPLLSCSYIQASLLATLAKALNLFFLFY